MKSRKRSGQFLCPICSHCTSSQPSVQCDFCDRWYHIRCVSCVEYEVNDLDQFACCWCEKLGHQMKHRLNRNRHNFYAANTAEQPTETGTPEFMEKLMGRHKVDLPLLRLARPTGWLLSSDGPTVVPASLSSDEPRFRLKMPPPQLDVDDVAGSIGRAETVDVIDAERQNELVMTLGDFARYFSAPDRWRVYNILSLEISNSTLGEMVEIPSIVDQLSWVRNYWPKDPQPAGETSPPISPTFESGAGLTPRVEKFCLMSAARSFTDFHIDFGGSSVWYHILWGKKVFYVVPPTDIALETYEKWHKLPNKCEVFFADLLLTESRRQGIDVTNWPTRPPANSTIGRSPTGCWRLELDAGDTLLLPSGWIHAVYTPVDSLVFGGNFLHDFAVDMQLRVYGIEQRLQTETRFMFPSFETLHWFAAQGVAEQLSDFTADERRPPAHLVQAARTMLEVLRSWTDRSNLTSANHRAQIPFSIEPSDVLSQLQRQLRLVDKNTGLSTSQTSQRSADNDVSSTSTSSLSLSAFLNGSSSPTPPPPTVAATLSDSNGFVAHAKQPAGDHLNNEVKPPIAESRSAVGSHQDKDSDNDKDNDKDKDKDKDQRFGALKLKIPKKILDRKLPIKLKLAVPSSSASTADETDPAAAPSDTTIGSPGANGQTAPLLQLPKLLIKVPKTNPAEETIGSLLGNQPPPDHPSPTSSPPTTTAAAATTTTTTTTGNSTATSGCRKRPKTTAKQRLSKKLKMHRLAQIHNSK